MIILLKTTKWKNGMSKLLKNDEVMAFIALETF
jgi:hypothetical protein